MPTISPHITAAIPQIQLTLPVSLIPACLFNFLHPGNPFVKSDMKSLQPLVNFTETTGFNLLPMYSVVNYFDVETKSNDFMLKAAIPKYMLVLSNHARDSIREKLLEFKDMDPQTIIGKLLAKLGFSVFS